MATEQTSEVPTMTSTTEQGRKRKKFIPLGKVHQTPTPLVLLMWEINREQP